MKKIPFLSVCKRWDQDQEVSQTSSLNPALLLARVESSPSFSIPHNYRVTVIGNDTIDMRRIKLLVTVAAAMLLLSGVYGLELDDDDEVRLLFSECIGVVCSARCMILLCIMYYV